MAAFKQVRKPFYLAPMYGLRNLAHETLPVKKLTQISAIFANRSAALCKGIGSLFDDESETAEKFRERAAKMDFTAAKLLKLNRSIFKPNSIDFRLRRNLWRLGKSLVKGSKFFVKFVAQEYMKHVTGDDGIPPYVNWELSKNKTGIYVVCVYVCVLSSYLSIYLSIYLPIYVTYLICICI